MKTFNFIFFMICVASALIINGAETAGTKKETIAVIPPKIDAEKKKTLPPDAIEGIAKYIEAKLSGNYTIYTRNATDQMTWELGFTQVMAIPDDERDFLEQRGVKYIFVYSISKIGSRFSMPMSVINASTGEVSDKQRTVIEAESFDILYNKIDPALAKMGLLAVESSNIKKLVVFPALMEKTEVKDAQALSVSFNNKLASFLLKSGSFELLNREELKQIADESNLVFSNMADSGQTVKVGQLQIADYIISTTISRLENTLKTFPPTIAGDTPSKTIVTMEMQIKIIEVKSGSTAAVESLICRIESTDIPASVRKDWSINDYNFALMEKASQQAGQCLLERLDPILVATVDDKNVILTRGAGAGVAVGQIYQVFNPGKKIIHPKTKKVIGTSEKLAAEVKIISVIPDMSNAEIISGGDMIQDGAVCRIKKSDAAPAQPLYPKAE